MDQVKNQQGQAVVEYALLLVMILMLFTGMMRLIEGADWYQSLTKPLTKDYKNIYQYGHPKAEARKYIAQDPDPGSFRVFLNPNTDR